MKIMTNIMITIIMIKSVVRFKLNIMHKYSSI